MKRKWLVLALILALLMSVPGTALAEETPVILGDRAEAAAMNTEDDYAEDDYADTETPAGTEPAEGEPSGDAPGGDLPTGDEPTGDEPGGDVPTGDEPGGDAPDPGEDPAPVCAHESMAYTYYDDAAEYAPVDGAQHRVTGLSVKSERCPDCGYSATYAAGEKPVEAEVLADHRYIDGVCADCGYRCPHDGLDGEPHEGAVRYEPLDAESHRAVTPTVVSGTCAQCGAAAERETGVSREKVQHHTWKNGVCTRCGYACAHPDEAIAETFGKAATRVRAVDSRRHRITRTRPYRVSCELCGAALFEEGETVSDDTAPHEFRDGVCKVCGYALEPEPEEEPEMPAFTDLDPSRQLYGVAANEALTLIETARRLGETLQPAVDAGTVRVSVPHLERLFTPDERARLDALPVRDRLLTTLYFTGFRDAVERARESDPALLSNAGLSLIEQIDARWSTQTEAERRARDHALEQLFPTTDADSNPAYDLEIDVSDARARYTFRPDGEEWVLASIAALA